MQENFPMQADRLGQQERVHKSTSPTAAPFRGFFFPRISCFSSFHACPGSKHGMAFIRSALGQLMLSPRQSQHQIPLHITGGSWMTESSTVSHFPACIQEAWWTSCLCLLSLFLCDPQSFMNRFERAFPRMTSTPLPRVLSPTEECSGFRVLMMLMG